MTFGIRSRITTRSIFQICLITIMRLFICILGVFCMFKEPSAPSCSSHLVCFCIYLPVYVCMHVYMYLCVGIYMCSQCVYRHSSCVHVHALMHNHTRSVWVCMCIFMNFHEIMCTLFSWLIFFWEEEEECELQNRSALFTCPSNRFCSWHLRHSFETC